MVFSNQALNTLINYAQRSLFDLCDIYRLKAKRSPLRCSKKIETISCVNLHNGGDIFVTDPPYADAVNYHEITEFFIAWLRKNPPPPFDQWTWDSRRDLAIKGKDEQFRRDMVAAYAAMTRHMPDNGSKS